MSNKATKVKTSDDVDADTGVLIRNVSITRGGKTRDFVVREVGYGQINKIGAGLNHQDSAKRQQSLETFGANIVSACVSENGVALTFEQAQALPGSIGKTLEKEALALNKEDGEEGGKEEAKNA